MSMSGFACLRDSSIGSQAVVASGCATLPRAADVNKSASVTTEFLAPLDYFMGYALADGVLSG
jgi:hypothetical protein